MGATKRDAEEIRMLIDKTIDCMPYMNLTEINELLNWSSHWRTETILHGHKPDDIVLDKH